MNSKVSIHQLLNIVLVSVFFLIGCKGKRAHVVSNKFFLASKTDPQLLFQTQRITKHEAEVFREEYIKYPSNLLNTVVADDTIENLLKFTFKGDDIREILKKIDTTADSTQDKIALQFGLDNHSTYGSTWHLIAYGWKKTTGFIETPDPITGKYSIFYNSDDAPLAVSYRTTKSAADDLRLNYGNSDLFLYTVYPTKAYPLYGFSFNADEIQEILNRNNFDGAPPDEIVFYLGVEFIKGKIKWHAIAYGSIGKNLLDVSNVGSTNPLLSKLPSVFDKADPCPKCHINKVSNPN